MEREGARRLEAQERETEQHKAQFREKIDALEAEIQKKEEERRAAHEGHISVSEMAAALDDYKAGMAQIEKTLMQERFAKFFEVERRAGKPLSKSKQPRPYYIKEFGVMEAWEAEKLGILDDVDV